MERLSELTIEDVKELVGGRKVQIFSTDDSAISVHMKDAVVIADPDAGTDGKITLLDPDTGCKIDLDSDNLIESIHGNENVIAIKFSNGMGELDIDIDKDTDKIVDQDELCQFIKDKLTRLSELSIKDIGFILNMEMEYLQIKGIVDQKICDLNIEKGTKQYGIIRIITNVKRTQ